LTNAWPPLQEILVTGLENTRNIKAIDIAKSLVDKWLKNVYKSYEDSGQKMFEKYDVIRIGFPGGGGEYDVQEGFGWSNGVLLHFLSKYPEMRFDNNNKDLGSNGLSINSTSCLFQTFFSLIAARLMS